MLFRSGTENATSSFDKFAQLFLERYGSTSDNFGDSKVTVCPDGKRQVSFSYTSQQIVNMLSYATVELFECAEQIIRHHRRSLLDYCIYFREKKREASTYEQYLHLMACDCLVHSNYFAPGISYSAVEFVVEEREYAQARFKKVKPDQEDEADGFEADE